MPYRRIPARFLPLFCATILAPKSFKKVTLPAENAKGTDRKRDLLAIAQKTPLQ